MYPLYEEYGAFPFMHVAIERSTVLYEYNGKSHSSIRRNLRRLTVVLEQQIAAFVVV